MAKKQAATDQTVAKSREYVEDSSSESDSENVSNEPKDPKKPTTSQSSSSDDESDTESNDQSGSRVVNVPSDSATTTTATKRRSDVFKPSQEPLQKKPKKQFTGVQRIAKDTYCPPVGYSTIELGDTDFVSQSANMFSDLAGKQIWHIIAPASLPITLVEKLDVTAAMQSEPILHHAGISYNMLATPSMGETLLLPKGANSIYSKTKIGVSQNFHLREKPQQKSGANGVAMSKSAESSAKRNDDDSQQLQFSAVKEGIRKPKREQPSGLLLRYQPYGRAQGSERPYRLQNPETSEAEENANKTSGNLVVPPSFDNEESGPDAATPKRSKHSKKLKNDGTGQDGNSSKEDGMDVDERVDGMNTPDSKVKTKQKRESAKKRRKHSQE